MSLKAIGKSGDWQIDLDEVQDHGNSARVRLGLTVVNRSFCIQMQIAHVKVIPQLLEFLNS